MADTYGMTGKILKIDLASQAAELLDTAAYTKWLGGPALAFRLLAELLPAELEDAFDEGNVLILAAGPLAGTGLPGGCAATVAALSPLSGTPSAASLGGRFASQLKYAGYDALVVTGRAAAPVWINISDNQVKVESAAFLWGSGTRNTTAQICAQAGGAAAVAAIGPAGENQAGLASVVSTGAFPAGGFGGVMGAKNLKAIAVQGTGPVAVADAPALLGRIEELCKSAVGVRGGYVVPAKAQSWSAFSSPASYWNASAGLGWGASTVPGVECPAGELSRMGRRTLSAARDFGDDAAQFITRAVACPSCPVGCLSALRLPALEPLGLPPYVLADPDSLLAAAELLPAPEDASGASGGSSSGASSSDSASESSSAASSLSESSSSSAGDGLSAAALQPAYDRLLVAAAGAALADDFGIWLADGQLARDFRYALESGLLEKALTQAEYTSFDWEQYEAGNPAFLNDFFRRIASGSGEFSYLGDGSRVVAERWKFAADYHEYALPGQDGLALALPGRSLHGAGELALAFLSAGELRRPLVHLLDCGLPAAQVSGIISHLAGTAAGCTANAGGLLIPDPSSAGRLAAWSAEAAQRAAGLGLCPHLWPITASPSAEAGYAGLPDGDAELLSLVTGVAVTPAELAREAREALSLQRAMAARYLGSENLAQEQDHAASRLSQAEAAGISQAELEGAFASLYADMGWNSATGLSPTSL